MTGESLADGRLYYDRALNETFIKPGATGLDYFRAFIPPWAKEEPLSHRCDHRRSDFLGTTKGGNSLTSCLFDRTIRWM